MLNCSAVAWRMRVFRWARVLLLVTLTQVEPLAGKTSSPRFISQISFLLDLISDLISVGLKNL